MIWCCLPLFLTAQSNNWRSLSDNPELLHQSIKQVTDVIVHDIYSPPVAGRIYAYVTIAGYEAALCSDNKFVSLSGQLHGLTAMPVADLDKEYCYALAAVNAVLTVAKSMIISEDRITNFKEKLLLEYKASGMPNEVFERSLLFGQKIAEHIINWASKDNYKQTRSLSKYAVMNDLGSWKPTPPSYMKGIEPHWGKLRTFIIDSAQQFKPAPATPFSSNKNSQFYKEANAVMEVSNHLTAAQIEVANFWDCNPFKMNINGHVMFATKKISPGGHWINITRLACKKAAANLVRSAEAYACISITMADAFISCWDEKYRSKVIRPETYINQYINQAWVPLLQTPPFPEYTSGHSVISAGCAIILEKLFGENFAYADSTEVEFNIPVRHFKSFRQAAEEAAISRFYGGIHYMPSIINGVHEGNNIGNFIVKKLRTKKLSQLAMVNNKIANIYLADPAIFYSKGKYYLYGTVEGNSNNGFLMYTSKDLKTWKIDSNKYGGYALRRKEAYGTKSFWAPQVFAANHAVYMAYAANENIAIAKSEDAEGPFTQKILAPLVAPLKQIDPFVFIDDDGKKYLYHVRLINGNYIYVAEMEPDFSAIIPSTLKQCLVESEDWENTQHSKWPVMEGPSVLKFKNMYYLFYSANDFRSDDYAVGYATSKSPYGPWTKYSGNPIISKKNLGVNGPGHGDFVKDAKNDLWYVMHTHFSDFMVGPRKTALIKINFLKDKKTLMYIAVADVKSFRYAETENE